MYKTTLCALSVLLPYLSTDRVGSALLNLTPMGQHLRCPLTNYKDPRYHMVLSSMLACVSNTSIVINLAACHWPNTSTTARPPTAYNVIYTKPYQK